jgi:hypothetical protein
MPNKQTRCPKALSIFQNLCEKLWESIEHVTRLGVRSFHQEEYGNQTVFQDCEIHCICNIQYVGISIFVKCWVDVVGFRPYNSTCTISVVLGRTDDSWSCSRSSRFLWERELCVCGHLNYTLIKRIWNAPFFPLNWDIEMLLQFGWHVHNPDRRILQCQRLTDEGWEVLDHGSTPFGISPWGKIH